MTQKKTPSLLPMAKNIKAGNQTEFFNIFNNQTIIIDKKFSQRLRKAIIKFISF